MAERAIQQHTIEIDGVETFRRVMVISSMIFAVISLLILTVSHENNFCEDKSTGVIFNLDPPIWTCFSVQICTFLLLILHYIKCGCLIRKAGASMAVFYFAMVGAMVYAQFEFFQATGCRSSTFIRYYWLMMNITLFYVFIAYGISLWGAYICWAAEEEENIAKEAMEWKFKKMVTQNQEQQRQMMLDQ